MPVHARTVSALDARVLSGGTEVGQASCSHSRSALLDHSHTSTKSRTCPPQVPPTLQFTIKMDNAQIAKYWSEEYAIGRIDLPDDTCRAELEEIKPLKVEPIFVDVYGDTEEGDPKDYKFR
ncbi:hypothetical protein F443_00287 [Phytophthora nicotianae P1569]|uniref:Uncharacterized protein n=2 Tax=Phytophthora nicotianae P1569 TaxID=1317065 RepID=V9G250_PHYNI|nr:hypothetical protein F443_00287 [Phytophthora nicotianae P1569]